LSDVMTTGSEFPVKLDAISLGIRRKRRLTKNAHRLGSPYDNVSQ